MTVSLQCFAVEAVGDGLTNLSIIIWVLQSFCGGWGCSAFVGARSPRARRSASHARSSSVEQADARFLVGIVSYALVRSLAGRSCRFPQTAEVIPCMRACAACTPWHRLSRFRKPTQVRIPTPDTPNTCRCQRLQGKGTHTHTQTLTCARKHAHAFLRTCERDRRSIPNLVSYVCWHRSLVYCLFRMLGVPLCYGWECTGL